MSGTRDTRGSRPVCENVGVRIENSVYAFAVGTVNIACDDTEHRRGLRACSGRGRRVEVSADRKLSNADVASMSPRSFCSSASA